MPTEPDGSRDALSYGLEAQVRTHAFFPCPRELDAIPEHAEVEHGDDQHGFPTPEYGDSLPSPFDYPLTEADGSSPSRIKQVEQIVLSLIEETYAGERLRVQDKISQLRIESRWDLELVAQIVVEKAFAEPLYSEACAMLACTLQTYLPPVARSSSRRRKKVEKFMHALLDVFQTVFEDVFFNPYQHVDSPLLPDHDKCVLQEQKHREGTTLQFAAYLHRWGLLGEKVISQMTQDLVDTGAVDVARELLRVVGIVLDNARSRTLGVTPTL